MKKLFMLLMVAVMLIGCTPVEAKNYKHTSAKSVENLSANEIELTAGETYNLEYTGEGKATFKSSDKKVIKVSKKGKITAVADGTAYVKVKSKGDTYKCKVVVTAPVEASITGYWYDEAQDGVYYFSEEGEVTVYISVTQGDGTKLRWDFPVGNMEGNVLIMSEENKIECVMSDDGEEMVMGGVDHLKRITVEEAAELGVVVE